MTRLWKDGILIQVEKDPRSQVQSFEWNGRRRAVEKVWQRWQVDSDWWTEQGRVHRDYCAVRTTDGLLCVLYFDFQDEQWYVSKLYD
ncbi:MAG: hypothetical protein M1132_13615 [Chloroflexi bacterium]|nr:hypothetical protein [Chloroflexota bacterium]